MLAMAASRYKKYVYHVESLAAIRTKQMLPIKLSHELQQLELLPQAQPLLRRLVMQTESFPHDPAALKLLPCRIYLSKNLDQDSNDLVLKSHNKDASTTHTSKGTGYYQRI